MREAERLRATLGKVVVLLEDPGDAEKAVEEAYLIAASEFADEPEVCLWRHHANYTYTRACDGRHTSLIPGSYMDGGDFEPDTICPGCGAKIEVRE